MTRRDKGMFLFCTVLPPTRTQHLNARARAALMDNGK